MGSDLSVKLISVSHLCPGLCECLSYALGIHSQGMQSCCPGNRQGRVAFFSEAQMQKACIKLFFSRMFLIHCIT